MINKARRITDPAYVPGQGHKQAPGASAAPSGAAPPEDTPYGPAGSWWNRGLTPEFSGYDWSKEGYGLESIGQQAWERPLGGLVRDNLGDDLLGLKLDENARAGLERTVAGLVATGIGVPAFMAAVNGLSTPQTAGTLPLSPV